MSASAAAANRAALAEKREGLRAEITVQSYRGFAIRAKGSGTEKL